MTADTLLQSLRSALGPNAVRTDVAALDMAANDLHISAARPLAVVRPVDSAGVAAAVAAAISLGYAVLPRGGGLSYTGGYSPPSSRSITVDMSGMNRILAIAESDMTITVQAGVTWKQIYEALKPRGLRLPFIGTFSGAGATVGGGLGHGALFFGSARYGSAAEIVLGLEVALADGTLLRTGQGALAAGSKPFLRTFGPDLTGLFTHDGGMFGIKTEASFRLIRTPAEQGYASFVFAGIEAAADALSEIARADLSEEVYILDPNAASAIPKDIGTVARVAKSVIRDTRGLRQAMKALYSVAKGGNRLIPEGHYSLHVAAAGRYLAAVNCDLAEARRIATGYGGTAIASTIPRVARAEIFANLNGVLGPQGRWAALNAKVAHSDARELIAAYDAMLSPHLPAMAAHGVTCTRLVSALGNHCFSFEPVLHWQDSWLPLQYQAPEPRHIATYSAPSENPEARALVNVLRRETVELFRTMGAASNQIGRVYPFREALSPAYRELLERMKRSLDPEGLMNPGVLGFA